MRDREEIFFGGNSGREERFHFGRSLMKCSPITNMEQGRKVEKRWGRWGEKERRKRERERENRGERAKSVVISKF
jgi:hypothetical protein